jgi:hypothetical protein
MHDIDRTQLEWEQYEHNLSGYELAQEEESESEYGAGVLHEETEMELAGDLLEVTNEEELEEFLGNVFRAVGSTLGRFAQSDTGRALTGIVRNAAREALPTIGGAVGSWISPTRGGAIGSQLAQQAGQLLGLELEGLSPQDQEFEAARQFVRFAGNAYANAAAAPRGAHPVGTAHRAAAAAAQQFAPGIELILARPQREQEQEFGRYRGFAYRRPYRPRPSRAYRPARPVPYRYPVYGGWAPYPYPAEPPAYADEPPPQFPADAGGDTGDGRPSDELTAAHAGSNGYAAGARNGRWVKRGRVLIVYGA